MALSRSLNIFELHFLIENTSTCLVSYKSYLKGQVNIAQRSTVRLQHGQWVGTRGVPNPDPQSNTLQLFIALEPLLLLPQSALCRPPSMLAHSQAHQGWLLLLPILLSRWSHQFLMQGVRNLGDAHLCLLYVYLYGRRLASDSQLDLFFRYQQELI